MIFKRDSEKDVLKKVINPCVIGFSCYLWNWQYNLHFAKLLKQKYPSAIIIFGGPQVPDNDNNFFKKYPFVDFCISKEGEIPFKNLLEAMVQNEELHKVPGIKSSTQSTTATINIRVKNLEEIPSPYTSGVFDQLISENPHIEWNAVLETNRGCPYACSFCDWGSLTYSKIFRISENRVFSDIDLFFKNKFGAIIIADANFGVFGERDERILDHIIEKQRKYARPYMISLNWAKNQTDRVLQMSKKLSHAGLNNGLTLSMQSMSPVVLENIHRKNMKLNKVNSILDSCSKDGLPNYTELILGLPGETLESWKSGIIELLKLEQHSGIEIFFALLLQNAELNKQREKYNIKSANIFGYISGGSASEAIAESVDIIVETNTMSYENFLKALRFNWLILNFHGAGWTQVIARTFNKLNISEYSLFYSQLDKWIENNPEAAWLKCLREDTLTDFENWFEHGVLDAKKWHDSEIDGWNLMYKANIDFYSKPKRFWQTLNAFLSGFDLEGSFQTDLIKSQKGFMVNFGGNYPKTESFNYNFLEFIFQKNDLVKNKYDYIFSSRESVEEFKDFADRLLFGRRRNFGQTQIKTM